MIKDFYSIQVTMLSDTYILHDLCTDMLIFSGYIAN